MKGTKHYVIQADKDVHNTIKILCALKGTKQVETLRYMTELALNTLNSAQKEVASKMLNGEA
jgi:hypothetical protein